MTADGETPLPQQLAHWDYQTTLDLAAPIFVNRQLVAESCALAENSGLAILVTAHSDHTRTEMSVAMIDVPLQSTSDLPVRISLDGGRLGGRLTLSSTLVVTDPKPLSELSPSLPGSIIWRTSHRTQLQGVGAQFPTDACDFRLDRRLDTKAAWALDLDTTDLDAKFLAAARSEIELRAPEGRTPPPGSFQRRDRPTSTHALLGCDTPTGDTGAPLRRGRLRRVRPGRFLRLRSPQEPSRHHLADGQPGEHQELVARRPDQDRAEASESLRARAMSGNFIYPRLGETAARQLLHERSEMSVSDLLALGTTSHPDAAPAPTGGHPVDAAHLRRLQVSLREVAVAAGYPHPIKRGKEQLFDRPCGNALYKQMEIVPADAADEGVWSFLTIVLVPEIGPWRFPDRAEPRLLGKPRNVLRRLWWRAWSLGEDLDFAPPGCRPLGEDEFVQIMERATLGGNPRIARGIRDALWRAELDGVAVARSDLMRELTRRVRAVRSHIALDALTDSQLEQLMDEVANQAAQSLAGLRAA